MPYQIIYQADLNPTGNDVVVVEAIEPKCAKVSIVTGNYPIDYLTKYEGTFDDENAACEIADQICLGQLAPFTVLLEL